MGDGSGRRVLQRGGRGGGLVVGGRSSGVGVGVGSGRGGMVRVSGRSLEVSTFEDTHAELWTLRSGGGGCGGCRRGGVSWQMKGRWGGEPRGGGAGLRGRGYLSRPRGRPGQVSAWERPGRCREWRGGVVAGRSNSGSGCGACSVSGIRLRGLRCFRD